MQKATSNKQVRSIGAVKVLGKAVGQLLIRKLLWTKDCSRCWTLWPWIRQSLSSVCVSVTERHAEHGCYSSFCCCDKISEKSSSRGKTVLIGLMVSTLSVHDWQKTLLAVPGMVEHHGRSHMVDSCSPHDKGKGRDIGWGSGQDVCLKNLPSLPESYQPHGGDF